jgi:hypothetical protein
MEDNWDREPTKIHTDTCHYYRNRDPSATTTTWHHVDTLEEAENLVRRLGKSKGGKHCEICLDGSTVT